MRNREGRIGAWGNAVALGLAALLSCSKGQDASRSDIATRASDSTGASTAAPASAKSNAGPGGARSLSTAPSAAGRRHTIIFVGTSLTAGLGLEPDSAYPMLIQQKIDSAGLPFDVVNAGVSGETSSGLLDRLDWLLRGTFDVMVLESGANDGLRGIPAATLRTNLEAAIRRIKARRPDARLVLVQMEALPNLGPRYASDFHAVYPEVARRTGVTLLPFFLADVAGRRELNQADGVHPNNVGEHIVANNVWRALRPILDSVARVEAGSPEP